MKEGLDQHFMVDKALVKRIVKYAKLNKHDIVLEIGPGKGVLTRELAKVVKVVAVEKDESLKEFLNIKNVELHFADAVKFIKRFVKFDKVVANIPYVISEPLLNQLKFKRFDLAILTVGSKSAKKLLGEEETKLSITAPLFFKIKKLEDVPKKSFSPVPRTDSAIIQLIPNKQESALKDFLLQEDKLAKNALRETLTRFKKFTKRAAKEKIGGLNLDLDKNVKLLSKEEIKKIKEITS